MHLLSVKGRFTLCVTFPFRHRSIFVPSEWSVFTLSVVFSHLPGRHTIGGQRLFPSDMQSTATECVFRYLLIIGTSIYKNRYVSTTDYLITTKVSHRQHVSTTQVVIIRSITKSHKIAEGCALVCAVFCDFVTLCDGPDDDHLIGRNMLSM